MTVKIENDFDLFKVITILWNRKTLLLTTTMICGFLAFIYTLFEPKTYEGKFNISIDEQNIFETFYILQTDILASDANIILGQEKETKPQQENTEDTSIVNSELITKKIIKNSGLYFSDNNKISKGKTAENLQITFVTTDISNARRSIEADLRKLTLAINDELKKDFILQINRNKIVFSQHLAKLENALIVIENQITEFSERNIQFLNEQLKLAQKLDFKDFNERRNHINFENAPYYLRGVKAIELEMESEKKKSLNQLAYEHGFADYIEITTRIDYLKKAIIFSRLEEEINKTFDESAGINEAVYLAKEPHETKLKSNSKIVIAFAMILGFFISSSAVLNRQ